MDVVISMLCLCAPAALSLGGQQVDVVISVLCLCAPGPAAWSFGGQQVDVVISVLCLCALCAPTAWSRTPLKLI